MSRPWSIPSLLLVLLLAAPAQAAPWGKLLLDGGKTVHLLDKPEIVVGSDAKADVVVAHSTVSGRHLRLRHDAGRVDVEDLGSKYGTLAAGTALRKGKPMRLLQNTVLALGAVDVVFEFGERPAVLQPTQPPSKARPAPAKEQAPTAKKPAAPAAKPAAPKK